MTEPVSGEDLAYHVWLSRRADVLVGPEDAEVDICLTENPDSYGVLFVNGEVVAEGFDWYEFGGTERIARVVEACNAVEGAARFRHKFDDAEGISFLSTEAREREEAIAAILSEMEFER